MQYIDIKKTQNPTSHPGPKKAIFIDRDGTIIREPADEQIDSLEKLEFVPGVISALKALTGRGYEFVLISNQDGLGTDSFPEETFWTAHNKMLDILKGEGIEFDRQLIDRSFPADNAPTRKPGLGMLGDYLTGTYDITKSFVIGDRRTDVGLAKNLGAIAIYLGKKEDSPEGAELSTSDWNCVARYILNSERVANVKRHTSETDISVQLDLNGNNESKIDTGLKFFDHMLWQIPHHSGISVALTCSGDLEVDEHHSMEDTGIALGEAIATALGDKRGIERYGFALPMDESRAMVLLDFGGRPDFRWNVEFTREYVGDTPTEMFEHFFKSLTFAMKANLHIEAKGSNNHHLIEGVFKAFARALRQAVKKDTFSYDLPTSKGII